MIEAANITIILIFEKKKKVGRSKHSNKSRSKKCVLIKKSTVNNILLQWILQSILENQTLQRTAKLIIWLIMVDFYGMDVMKGIGSKIRWDVQNLQVYYPLFIGREIKMELDDQSFCWSLPLNVHTFTTPLLY